MKSEQTFRTEFPDFPADSSAIATLMARGFVDTSWHNNACPSFEAMGLRVWIDFPHPEARDIVNAEFTVAYSVNEWDGMSEFGLLFSYEFADVIAFLDGYATEFNALPEWAIKSITSRVEAEDFIRSAHDAGKLWHLDDSPEGVEGFTQAEIGAFVLRRDECFEHTEGDPHEYCIFLTNRPASWRALDDAMRAKFGQGLSAEQRACMENAEQREECLDMLDDMQARLDIAADVVLAVVNELDGDWQ